MLAPGVLYVLGPAILGVPHILSELRFLVLRREHPRPWLAIVVGAAALLVAIRVASVVAPSLAWAPEAEVAIGWGLGVAGAIFGGLAGRRLGRAFAFSVPLIAALVWAVMHPGLARLALAHAHNVITIGLWFWLFRRRKLFALPALVLIAIAAYALTSGATTPHVRFDGPWAMRMVKETMWSVPAFVPQRLALGIGLSFVFLQSIHYAVWLAWIPQEDVLGEGTTTFRMSARSLVRDLGRVGVILGVLLGALMVLASFVDLHRTRGLYLSLATFHGYVEIAMMAFLGARGAREHR
jgi:hypothetical protein